ncbi:MAG: response regulator transcription factor, partial [Planctomycetota bacterium]
REGLSDALRAEGYEVLSAATGHDGLHLGLTEDPDLVVLDINLPGLDGFEVLKRLRADAVETPVLLLTARGLERDRVRGLDLGADDYVVKPFGLAELLARIRSRLRAWDRERGFEDGTVFRFAGLTVDFSARSAVRDGKDVGLTPKEFELLEFLALNEGTALRRARLLAQVWRDEDVVSRVIDMAVLGLRKKIEPDPANPRHILAVRGVGYRFSRRG